MNTARMNSLLIRQKHNLLNDALYALMVAIGLVIYLLGLGLGTSVEVTNESHAPVPPASVDSLGDSLGDSPVEQAGSCTPDSSASVAQLC